MSAPLPPSRPATAAGAPAAAPLEVPAVAPASAPAAASAPALDTRPAEAAPPGTRRASAPTGTALGRNAAVIVALVERDLRRFVRAPSRVFGSLVQPLAFWALLGSGLAGSFRAPGAAADAAGGSYLAYFFPGTLVMFLLFSAIVGTISLIEDRHAGFLQGVLVAPASRLSIVCGKTLAGSLLAFAQVMLLAAAAPLGGYAFGDIAWGALAAQLAVAAVALNALGFAIAWWFDSSQGYHVVMSVALLPMWALSGALFPAEGAHAWVAWAIRLNPLSFAVQGVRAALGGGAGLGALAGTAVFALVCLGVASFVASREARPS